MHGCHVRLVSGGYLLYEGISAIAGLPRATGTSCCEVLYRRALSFAHPRRQPSLHYSLSRLPQQIQPSLFRLVACTMEEYVSLAPC